MGHGAHVTLGSRSVAWHQRPLTLGTRRVSRGTVVANQRTSNSRLLAVGVAVLAVGVLLVLLIVRNSGDDAPPASPPAAEQPTTPTGPAQPTPPQPLTPEQLSTARVQLPMAVPDGMEAIAIRVNFMRSVAAVPLPGDRVNLYRLAPAERQPQADADEPEPGIVTPGAQPAPVQVVGDVEVLAVTGPLPAANDGTLTLVVAVPSADIPAAMEVANDAEAWFTLLPSPEGDEEDDA
jgi:hypothetical protein